MQNFLFRSVFLIICSFVPQVQAMSLPDAGQILQQQKQIPNKLPRQLPEPEEKTKTEPQRQGNNVNIKITSFRFSGYESAVTEAELQAIVKSAVGQSLSYSQLENLTNKITNYLRFKGYFLAKAYLPRQEIVNGIVLITIIAGQVEGSPDLQLHSPSRINKEILRKIDLIGAPSGKGLRQKRLERSLLLMNDLPGISAKSILEKGSSPGSTHVIIDAQEGPLLNGIFSVNNFGNRFLGKKQGVIKIAANDPSGIGDQLSANLTLAENLTDETFNYTLPFGSSALKGGVSYNNLRYALGKEFKNLNIKGSVNTFITQLSYPFFRSRSFSLWQGLHYEYRRLEDKAAGILTGKRHLHIGSAITTVNSKDNFAGGGLSNLVLQINAGTLSFDLDAQNTADKATANSAGSYTKLAYTFSRLQLLPNNFSFFAIFSGQFASKNLDSSEKFILGGTAGVRAYPVGEASGDEGYRLTTEARYDMPHKVISSDLQFVAFFDTGHIQLHNSPWRNAITNATGKNSYELSGAGFGVNLDNPGKYSLHASYAHTIGNNSGRSISGKNADNLSGNQQLWLQAIIWF